MASMSETGEPAGHQWIHGPTEEPLSPELRAAVVEDLKESWYFGETEEYRRFLKAAWINEGYHQTIKDPNVSLEPQQLYRFCNKLMAFYWMPSPQVDGRPLPMTPFGCIYKEWIRYHNGRPPIEFQDFFAHLVRVYPTGPTTIQEVIAAHKSLCQEAVSLLGRIERGEAKRPNGLAWRDPRAYNLNPTYHGIIIVMDQYLEPDFEPDLGELIDLHEQAQKLTVLLVRTGDDSNLCAPINFEELRTNGFCLPLARSDVSATCDDVVRVSLATAVKFVSDLHQREVDTHPPTEAVRDWEQRAQRYADETMKKADADGIDNVRPTWTAVRRVKAARKGEIFEPREPYPFSRYWK
jgi:hypothetical protein